jgi:acetolactate synthase-1/3 small subunit
MVTLSTLHSPSVMRHLIAVRVDNEFGMLARVVGLFAGRGYNIESLTVAPVTQDGTQSRITIVTRGEPPVIAQIMALLARLIPVHHVQDLTLEMEPIERELALVKLAPHAVLEQLPRSSEIATRVLHVRAGYTVLEATGTASALDAWCSTLPEGTVVAVARTGVTGMLPGAPAAWEAC